MTGNKYDQLLVDADPYRPGTAGSPEPELVAQILAEPQSKFAWLQTRLAVAAAAAAVIIAVAIPIVLNRTSGQPAVPAAPTSSASVSPSAEPAPSLPGPDPGSGSLLEPDKVKKAAEQGPRIVIGEPGWKIIHLEPFADDMGEMAWQKGEPMLNMSWYPAKEYNARRYDKNKGAEKVKIGDLTGWLTTLSKNDFRVMTEPHDGIFAGLQAPPGLTRAEFRTMLAGMRTVSADEWIASASRDVARAGEAGDRAYRLFANGGLTRPRTWEHDDLKRLPAEGDAYEFDTALTRQVACGWLELWVAGDKSAGPGLLGSENWTVLRDLETQGSDLRKTITGMATRLTSGQATGAEVDAYRQQFC